MISLHSVDELNGVRQKEEAFLLFVSSPDCGACSFYYVQVMQMTDMNDFPAYHVESSQVPTIADTLNLSETPAVCLFVQGEEIYRGSGFVNPADLEDQIILLKQEKDK